MAAALRKKQQAIADRLLKKLAKLQKGALGTAKAVTAAPKATSATKTSKYICYLCRKKFKSEALLRRHVAESELHKANLKKKQDAEKAAAGQNA